MYTIGGVIDEADARKKLRKAGIYKLPHVEPSAKIRTISVPPLTVREKEWIDSKLISSSRKTRKDLGFDKRLLRNYSKYYKYYPTYYEALV